MKFMRAILVLTLLFAESKAYAGKLTYETTVLKKNRSGAHFIESKRVDINTETGLITWNIGDAGLGLAIENKQLDSSDFINPIPDLGLALPASTNWPDKWESGGRVYEWEESYLRLLGVEFEDVRKVTKLNNVDETSSDSIYYYSMGKGLIGFAYVTDDGDVEAYWLSGEKGLNYYELKNHFNEAWWKRKNKSE